MGCLDNEDCISSEDSSEEEIGEEKYSSAEKEICWIDEEKERCSSVEKEICCVDVSKQLRDEFQKIIEVKIERSDSFSCISRIDTGCLISLIKGFIEKNFGENLIGNGIIIMELISLNLILLDW